MFRTHLPRPRCNRRCPALPRCKRAPRDESASMCRTRQGVTTVVSDAHIRALRGATFSGGVHAARTSSSTAELVNQAWRVTHKCDHDVDIKRRREQKQYDTCSTCPRFRAARFAQAGKVEIFAVTDASIRCVFRCSRRPQCSIVLGRRGQQSRCNIIVRAAQRHLMQL